jgi:hypothetical protein
VLEALSSRWLTGGPKAKARSLLPIYTTSARAKTKAKNAKAKGRSMASKINEWVKKKKGCGLVL